MSQVTLTAHTGPASAIAARVITGVRRINLDLEHKVGQIFSDGNEKPQEFDLAGITTITDNITSDDHVVVIS